MAARTGLARLWAPWRMTYIRTAHEPSGCLFCRVARARDDRRDLVLHRGPEAFVMLNRYPYNPAHLMVAVPRHVASFAELSPTERAALMDAVGLAESALDAEYGPHGMNLGANLGRVAGAGFPGHLHVHLVPRWNGDTNFMPVVGETRVLPESLDRTWTRLRKAMTALEGGARRTRSLRDPGRPTPRRPRVERGAARRTRGKRG